MRGARGFSLNFHYLSHAAEGCRRMIIFDLHRGCWIMKRLVLTILVVLSFAAAAEAQTFRGTILGTVTDTSGLAVAGATITVKNTETGLARATQTTADGSYTVTELPQVETTTNELGGVLTSTTVENIPVNGRDYTKLIYLNPGVAGSPDQISDSPGSYGVFSMNGSRGRSNNFLLDGTDMNDGYRNDPAINEAGVFGTPATILPIDAVAEL